MTTFTNSQRNFNNAQQGHPNFWGQAPGVFSYPIPQLSFEDLLDNKQLKIQYIYKVMCNLTDDTRLRDFYWFNRTAIYGAINVARIQDGVWSNDGIHAIIGRNNSIIVGNADVSIRISHDINQCDIFKNDDASEFTSVS